MFLILQRIARKYTKMFNAVKEPLSCSLNIWFCDAQCQRKIFNLVSKVIRDCIGFASLRSVLTNQMQN